MAASVSPTSKSSSALASQTFRQALDSARSRGQRIPLEDVIATLVPLCLDVKARHDRGEMLVLHASAVQTDGAGQATFDPRVGGPRSDRDRVQIAPESQQTLAPGNSRASVFAIGAMLYEAMTGAGVGPGMRRPCEIDPTIPEGLEVLLAKALVANPAHRPDDLGALAAALHQLAPKRGTAPPPAADVSRLDKTDEFEVDVRMSLLPMSEVPSAPKQIVAIQMPKDPFGSVVDARPSRPRTDATAELAELKAQLESDPRPRYVVIRDMMDHGPFSAVELLQQIASNQFVGENELRDELAGRTMKINEWPEFAPFAEHAHLHRKIVQEKKEVIQLEKKERKAGAAKYVVGGVVTVALLGGLGFWLMERRGARADGSGVEDDPSAIDLSVDGGLGGKRKVAGKGGGGGGKGGGGGGGSFSGGMSYEAALNSNNEEVVMGAKTGPDLSNAQLSGPLANAAFISGCGAPNDMKVQIRTAVKNGRAVGVTVTTTPQDNGVAGCVDRHVRGLSWPQSPKMDSFTTNY